MRPLPVTLIIFALIFTAFLSACESTAEAPNQDYIDGLESHKSECDQLQSAKKESCISSIDRLIRSYQELVGNSTSGEDQSQLELEIEEVVFSLPELLERANQPDVVCQVNDLGMITCIRFSDLLVGYDAEFAQIMIGDIESLYLVLGLDKSKPILAGCGNGTWSTFLPSEVDAESVEDVVENIDSHAASFLDFCIGVRGEAQGTPSYAASPGDFSGVTGFDPFGGLGDCAPAASLGPSIGEMLFATFGSWHSTCSQSLQSSMMEGGQDPEETPEPPPETPEPKKPTRTLPPDEQIAETQSATSAQGSVDTITYEDGTEVLITTDPDGKTVIMITFPDGQSDWQVIGPDGRKIEDGTTRDGGYTNKYNSDGSVTTVNNDGSTWTRFPDGYSIYEHWNGAAYLYNPDGTFAYAIFNPINPDDCIDETCQTCANLASLIPNLINDCTSGGAAFLCQAFFGAASCCNNPASLAADPRLVIPDPQGNFICSDGAGIAATSTCEERCKVASMEENCLANCGSLVEMNLIQFNAMDAICLMATWDACFESELPDLGIDLGLNPSGGIGPLPVPETELDVLDHLLFDSRPDEP